MVISYHKSCYTFAGGMVEEKEFTRKFLRIRPEVPLSGMIRIIRVGGRHTVSRQAKVRIIDISPGGVKFSSGLRFPIDAGVILQLSTELEGIHFCTNGFVVHRSGGGDKEYEYGFCFSEPLFRLKEVLIEIFARSVIRNNRHIIFIDPDAGNCDK